MSGYDLFNENPFSDPNGRQASGPAVTQSGNPSANQPSSDGTRVNTAVLDQYNPFEHEQQSSAPATLPTSDVAPASTTVDLATDLERRQKELDARAAELARREEEQDRRAAEQKMGGAKPKNFPPLPKFCPCAPCFYHDIEGEIASPHQQIVKQGYYTWIAYTILMLINWVGTIVYFGGSGKSNGGELFGMGLFAMLLCPPLSFICWFRPLYKAFKSDSSMYFFIFFFVMFAQIVVIVLQSMSFFNLGACGFLYALSVTGIPWLCGIMFTIFALFVLSGLGCLYLLIKVHALYRNTDASFNKARQEFIRGVANDPNVRSAAFGTPN